MCAWVSKATRPPREVSTLAIRQNGDHGKLRRAPYPWRAPTQPHTRAWHASFLRVPKAFGCVRIISGAHVRIVVGNAEPSQDVEHFGLLPALDIDLQRFFGAREHGKTRVALRRLEHDALDLFGVQRALKLRILQRVFGRATAAVEPTRTHKVSIGAGLEELRFRLGALGQQPVDGARLYATVLPILRVLLERNGHVCAVRELHEVHRQCIKVIRVLQVADGLVEKLLLVLGFIALALLLQPLDELIVARKSSACSTLPVLAALVVAIRIDFDRRRGNRHQRGRCAGGSKDAAR
mmetsp:Transcript_83404/g.249981  ORF Transcript_83404/g.249981 Transcript_83404/m.249981 type:complete len:294 (-) Transcript_83404:122-1003(-)